MFTQLVMADAHYLKLSDLESDRETLAPDDYI